MIRFAKESDVDKIMVFIDTYWKKGHILGTEKAFFMYEHVLKEGVTYVVSENSEGEIDAILGYIPYGETNRDIMTVMWKANHTAKPSLGIELLNFLKENGDVRILASPGSNKKLAGLYAYLGYEFGKMTQWYRINDAKKEFEIAKIEDTTIPMVKGTNDYELYETWESLEVSFDFEKYKRTEPRPYKEPWYIRKRYYKHPIYKYLVYGIKNNSKKADLLVVFRVVEVENTKVIRLIDCIGDFSLISCVSNLLDELLHRYEAEYVDCYEVGIPDEIMKSGGWLKTSESPNVIPNYFEPFVKENVDIFYFSSEAGIVLFKGDGDQDRPSVVIRS